MISISEKTVSRYQRIEWLWSLLWKGMGQTLNDFIFLYEKDVDHINHRDISDINDFILGVIGVIQVCIGHSDSRISSKFGL